jgi:hypothetical protein
VALVALGDDIGAVMYLTAIELGHRKPAYLRMHPVLDIEEVLAAA